MTESSDTITNYRQSDSNNHDNPIDLFLIPIHQQEQIDNEFGLLDDNEDDLSPLDFKPIRKSDYDLSIVDKLAHQCDAVLLPSTLPQTSVRSTTSSNSHPSNLMTTTMINDYERRFQCSLQKLTVPSWYTEPAPSYKIANTPSLISTSHNDREIHRTPEIVHVQRPHSYRSYRSSLGTSPSPSLHSWHPNHMTDGMNFPSSLPSSSSTSRRHDKHEKGIQRVTKSSHWYQPTQFLVAKKKSDQMTTSKTPVVQYEPSKSNYYDIPKLDFNHHMTNRIEENFISNQNRISELSSQQKRNYSTDDYDITNVENTSIYQQNNTNTGNHSLANDKQHDRRINSNGFQTMPLADENILFGRVELEDVTDEEENDKRSSTNNIRTVKEITDDDETNTLLERLANNLVDSILNDVLHLQTVEHEEEDEEDTDTGVRELSDDENALRELDENDMSGTDEFIVFSTKANAYDDTDQNQQTSPVISRSSLNRLYTFSRTNNDGTINSKTSSNQDSPTSTLMIVDKKFSITNSLLNTSPDQPVNTMIYPEHDVSNHSLPIYRSHIQKRHINLGRYYDGMMRATNSQIPTHDLRCNLHLNNPNTQLSSDGVSEETVRKGRLLLDSIPNSIELTKDINEDVHEQSVPVRSILKNTRFALSDEPKLDDHVLRIEEDPRVSPRKIITTITEEYHRIQRKVIEEVDQDSLTVESNDDACRDSDYSSNHERLHTPRTLVPSVSINNQSPYELLSECYSGYSYIRSDFLIPTNSPLISNVSSLQSTTDEAYESEPTTSPRSPTMSSSTATTNHIHPELEHEFEFLSPPPPVPDRRLKPAHLRPPPPPTKPRTNRPQQQQRKDLSIYSKIKNKKTSPLTVVQRLMASTANDSTLSSIRTLSSRHYCGSLPSTSELPISSSDSPANIKKDKISNSNSKAHDSSNSATNNDNTRQIVFTKSPSSSLNIIKSKRSSSTCFDETTNGLAVRLPVPVSDGYNSNNKQNLHRISTPSSTKSTEGTTKTRPISENLNSHRSSIYETSV